MSATTGASGKIGGASAGRQAWRSRNFVVIWMVNFMFTVVFLLLMIVMAKVATDRFGVSPAMAGLSASMFIIGSFAVRPFLGDADPSDRPGQDLVHRNLVSAWR